MVDLDQYAKSFKVSIEPIKYLQDMATKTIKICRMITQEIGISSLSCDPITMIIRDSINALVKNCSESINILNESILGPIQSFLINNNLKVEECKYKAKEIIDQAIKLYENTEITKKNYFDVKDTYTETRNTLTKLRNSENGVNESKIKAISSNLNYNK